MFKKFYIIFIIFLSTFSFMYSDNISVDTTNSNDYFKPIDTTYISSYFGYRDLNGRNNFHDGIDFPAVENTKVYSTMAGIVINSSFINGYGNTVIILHSNGSKSLYGHLSENFLVYNGQNVSKRQVIATVGPKYLSNGKLNGFTTGPHLHFSIFNSNGKQVDPLSLGLK